MLEIVYAISKRRLEYLDIYIIENVCIQKDTRILYICYYLGERKRRK